jgi:hypothetical protein
MDRGADSIVAHEYSERRRLNAGAVSLLLDTAPA